MKTIDERVEEMLLHVCKWLDDWNNMTELPCDVFRRQLTEHEEAVQQEERERIKKAVEAMENKSYGGYPEASAHIMGWNIALEAVADLLEVSDAERK